MLKDAVREFEIGSEWKRITSTTANKGYGNPPYWKRLSAYETVTTKQDVFYRVHGSDNQVGVWLFKFDPRSISKRELKELLGLEFMPDTISRVTVPANTRMRVGIAGEIPGWGKGGVVQWELLVANSQDPRSLGVVFEDLGTL